MNRIKRATKTEGADRSLRDSFWYYLFTRRWKAFTAISLVGIIGGLLDLAVPVVMGRFIDSLWETTSSDESVAYLTALAALMVVSTVLMTVSDYSLGLVAEETVFGLRRKLVRRAFRQQIAWYQKVSPGDWSSRLTNDPEKLRVAINNGPVEIFLNTALLLATVSVMLWLSPLLVLVVVVVAILGTAVVLVLSSRLEKSIGLSQEKIGELSDCAISGFENIRMIRGNNIVNPYTESTLDVIGDTYRLGRIVAKNKSLIVPIGGSVAQLSLIAVFGIGGWMVSLGRITIGDFITFLMLVVYLAVPLGTLFNAISILQSSKASLQRIIEAASPEIVNDSNGPDFRPTNEQAGVQFDAVTFQYPGERILLDNLSFTVPTGKTFALLGPSGIGKSTIFDMLVKFVAPDAGEVKIFGTDISLASNESVRELIGFSQQQSRPFGSTIRSYLSKARNGLSDEELWNALEKVALDSKVNSLREKLDAKLGTRGSLFSGGELQRLSLAFCLLRKAPIVLLDEPTTGLDEKTAGIVVDDIFSEFRNSTCIIATHNKRLAELCDGKIDIGKSRHLETLHSLEK